MNNKIKTLFAMACITLAGSFAQAQQKPNIIYILADDMGIGDLSVYGQKKMTTPNIDSLATGGMRFTDHYSGTAVCAPSRCSLMTGKHTGHSAIRGNGWSQFCNEEGQLEMPADTNTIPKMLKKEGYSTALFGKWGLGYEGTHSSPNAMGFDEFFGYNCQAKAHSFYPDHLWHNGKKIMLEGNQEEKKFYSGDMIQDAVLKFISNADPKKPFFIYYASTLPHAELYLPERYQVAFNGKFEPETPYEGQKFKDSYGRFPGYTSQPKPRAAFAAMVHTLDEYVGQIVKELKDRDLLDNTLILFSSDNGAHQEGGHDPEYFDSNSIYRGHKRDLTEGGIRAPFIVYWNGKIKPGSVSNYISGFWDMMPTFAQLAGAKAPEDTDGVSIVPTLMGEKQAPKELLYWELHNNRALRMGDWKLLSLSPRFSKTKQEPKLELYNLAQDPSEENDLSSKYPEKVAEMNKILISSRVPSFSEKE